MTGVCHSHYSAFYDRIDRRLGPARGYDDGSHHATCRVILTEKLRFELLEISYRTNITFLLHNYRSWGAPVDGDGCGGYAGVEHGITSRHGHVSGCPIIASHVTLHNYPPRHFINSRGYTLTYVT